MKITLRYFASLRESIGQSQEELHTTALNAGQVRDELLSRGDAYACVGRERAGRRAAPPPRHRFPLRGRSRRRSCLGSRLGQDR